MPPDAEPLYYQDYLQLDRLLDCQRLESERMGRPAHDEMLFIVVHQAYELWFKQILHELDHLERTLEAGELPTALHTLNRILTILKIAVAQVDVLETMTPIDFLSFRDRLETASGGQSWQFREVEFALGVKSERALVEFPEGSDAHGRLEARLARPSLWDALLRYLERAGYEVPPAALGRDLTARPARITTPQCSAGTTRTTAQPITATAATTPMPQSTGAATAISCIAFVRSARSALLSTKTRAVVRDGCVAANSAAVASAPGYAIRAASRLPRASSTAALRSMLTGTNRR